MNYTTMQSNGKGGKDSADFFKKHFTPLQKKWYTYLVKGKEGCP
jgi:hypothetical protein